MEENYMFEAETEEIVIPKKAKFASAFNKVAAPALSFGVSAGMTAAARLGAAEFSESLGYDGLFVTLLTGITVTGAQFVLDVLKTMHSNYHNNAGSSYVKSFGDVFKDLKCRGARKYGSKFLLNTTFAGLGSYLVPDNWQNWVDEKLTQLPFLGQGWLFLKDAFLGVMQCAADVYDFFSDALDEFTESGQRGTYSEPMESDYMGLHGDDVVPIPTPEDDAQIVDFSDDPDESVIQPDKEACSTAGILGVIEENDFPLADDLTEEFDANAGPDLCHTMLEALESVEGPDLSVVELINQMELGEDDVPQIAKEYVQGALEGRGWGTLSLADWVANGRYGFEKNLELARELAEVALKQGSVNADEFLIDLDRYTEVDVELEKTFGQSGRIDLLNPECTVYATIGEPPLVQCDNLYGRHVDMDHPLKATFVNKETGESVQSVFRRQAPLDAYDFVGREFVPRYVETAVYEELPNFAVLDSFDRPDIALSGD